MFFSRWWYLIAAVGFIVGVMFAQAPVTPVNTDMPLLVVSGYEYPILDAILEGKLQHLYYDEDQNNQTTYPGGPIGHLAAFPYGEKMLLVATVNTQALGADCVTGIRWSFMETGRRTYGGKFGVEVSIIKGAGVGEDKIPTASDQIITQLGVGPTYPPLPQTVVGFKVGSSEPVDEIKIASNQSWVIVRSFEPGVSKVLVSVVSGKNTVTPEVEYAVNWIGKYSPLCQRQRLQVNVVEAAKTPDPYIFQTAEDQCLGYKTTVTDVSDYYQNPTAACVRPLLYPDIHYRLRFRIDPLQQSNPPWPDAYWVDWGLCDSACCGSHHDRRLDAKYGIGTYVQRTTTRLEFITPTVNGATPGATQSFDASAVFAPYDPDPKFFYFDAKERSVDASLAYYGNSGYIYVPENYRDINDESITIEYQPNEVIGGLEITWDPINSPQGYAAPVCLKNTGGRIYEIFGESPVGLRWHILKYLKAGAVVWVDADHGDWIYYHTISNNNSGTCCEPVIAKQRKARVQ